MTSRRAGGGAAAAAGTSPDPGSVLRQPPVLVEHWAGSCVIIQYGGGAGHPRPSPARSQREKGDRVSSPASQQGRTRTPRVPRLFLP